MTGNDDVCCSATRREDRSRRLHNDRTSSAESLSTDPPVSDDDRIISMAHLEGGTFTMGSDSDEGFPQDGEGPARKVDLSPFYIDQYAVTNAQYLQFVRETGYTTDAERYGWSFVFEGFVEDDDREHIMQTVSEASWWVAIEGADWLHPYGPTSSILDNSDLLKHPVTHVSWNDARAYCEWAGKRLPTEAEWEYAARGGLTGKRYPWGDDLTPGGTHRCNIWQGEFPEHNTGEDGYQQTAPVNEYEPNGHGLYNVSGNVWEWCADWFSADYHTTEAYAHSNPKGPQSGRYRVIRGGSHLCHHSWCNRYRVAARSKNTPDSTTSNIGFRCVVDAVPK